MASFWKHAVRTPMLGITVAFIALGWWGALDWGPALSAATIAALIAKAADSFARRYDEDDEPPAIITDLPSTPSYRQYENKYDRAA
ncbi:MAG: hypothetical protein R3B97_07755 [Dehalococcoidia bacterium]|nr:hypothetical protein [Dehalococcoidia bacterium]